MYHFHSPIKRKGNFEIEQTSFFTSSLLRAIWVFEKGERGNQMNIPSILQKVISIDVHGNDDSDVSILVDVNASWTEQEKNILEG